jgi:hypothetical protein
MALFGLIGNTSTLAAKYAAQGKESATSRKDRKEAEKSARRRAKHRNGGATRAARAGQQWDDNERRAEGGY